MNDLEKKLTQIRPPELSAEEKGRVWQGINVAMQIPGVSQASYLSTLIKQPMFTTLAITLVLLLGAGGTALAADSAKPGDALFSLDRALERAELSFTSDDRKDDKRFGFAEERLNEIHDLNDDSRNRSDSDDDRKERISVGVASLTSLLADVKDDSRRDQIERILDELNIDLESIPADTRIEVRDDRFEVRNSEGRLRIDIKNDGEIRIKTDDNNNDDDSRSSSDNSSSFEIEADIFTDTTTVKVELNDVKTTFTTSADTRSEVTDQVLLRFPDLTRAQIDAVLDLEVEDRASRPQDIDNNGGSSGDDSDDDSDDNSGHGGGEEDDDDDSDHN